MTANDGMLPILLLATSMAPVLLFLSGLTLLRSAVSAGPLEDFQAARVEGLLIVTLMAQIAPMTIAYFHGRASSRLRLLEALFVVEPVVHLLLRVDGDLPDATGAAGAADLIWAMALLGAKLVIISQWARTLKPPTKPQVPI